MFPCGDGRAQGLNPGSPAPKHSPPTASSWRSSSAPHPLLSVGVPLGSPEQAGGGASGWCENLWRCHFCARPPAASVKRRLAAFLCGKGAATFPSLSPESGGVGWGGGAEMETGRGRPTAGPPAALPGAGPRGDAWASPRVSESSANSWQMRGRPVFHGQTGERHCNPL